MISDAELDAIQARADAAEYGFHNTDVKILVAELREARNTVRTRREALVRRNVARQVAMECAEIAVKFRAVDSAAAICREFGIEDD